MNRITNLIITFAILFLLSGNLAAEIAPAKPGIRVDGRKSATVNQAAIRLSDLAEVSSASSQDDDTVIALQKMLIDPAPAAGSEITISASRILERMKEQGVKLSEIVYSLPRIIKVTRAHRELTNVEIEQALRKALKDNGREATLSHISYKQQLKVPPSTSELKAQMFQTSKPGVLGFKVSAEVPGEQDLNFEVTAQLEEWINLPIASRPLNKGETIKDQDLVMARVNIASLPSDSIYRADDIVGKQVSNDIQHGEAFRRNKIVIPAIIETGSKVVLVYKAGILEATATGVAMEPGILGQQIKVKNENSKKIIVGKVLEAGKVGVNP